MYETGLGRGEENRGRGIERLVAKLDSEQDKGTLTRLLAQTEGSAGSIAGAQQVEAAIERAKRRLHDI